MSIQSLYRSHSPCLPALAALSLWLGLALPAAGQGAGHTSWSYQYQIEDLDTSEVLLSEPLSSGSIYSPVDLPVDTGPGGHFILVANPEVDMAGGAPKLRAQAQVTQLSTHAGRGVRAISQASAGLIDTFTVTAGPDFSGGYLMFPWQVEGLMKAQLSADATAFAPNLKFVGWEFYQRAELSATGPGLPRTTLAKYTWDYTSSGPIDEMTAFDDYLEWDDGPLLLEPDAEIAFDELVGGGASHEFRLALTPGVPVAVEFHLDAGVNMGVFNVDNVEIAVADNGMFFAQTATLAGVQLLDAAGSPYAGEWTLTSNSGTAYAQLPVPEPATTLLWLAGLALLGPLAAARRRQRAGWRQLHS